MALTPTEQASVDRLAEYNGDQYDAATNPRGFGDPGYQTEFPRALNDAAIASEAVARLAGEADDSAAAAAGSATAASGSATTAAGHAAAAADQVTLAAAQVTLAAAQVALAEGHADDAAASAQEAVDAVASVNLPTITGSDAGKLLRVNGAGDGYEVANPFAPFANALELAATVRLQA